MDPELGRPITDLDMVQDVLIDDAGQVTVTILLTTPACPLRDRFTQEVVEAVSRVEGVSGVAVTMVSINFTLSLRRATYRAPQNTFARATQSVLNTRPPTVTPLSSSAVYASVSS